MTGLVLGSAPWDTVYRRSENIVSRTVAGELFIVPVSGSIANLQKLFALTPVAERIWNLCDGRRRLGEIRDVIVESFDAESGQIESDIREFIEQLLAAELLLKDERQVDGLRAR